MCLVHPAGGLLPAAPDGAPATKAGGHLQHREESAAQGAGDAGIRINVVVSDVYGASARAMIKALVAGQAMHGVLDHGIRRAACAPAETRCSRR